MDEMTAIQLTGMQPIVLCCALMLLVIQSFVQKKHTMHILFAIFCGSVAMSVAQDIAGNSLGAWQYIIGMGACATCNIYWLLSRTMFREKNPIAFHHIAFAMTLGLLMMLRQGYRFADSYWQLSPAVKSMFPGILSEAMVMLSSFVLIMAVWEGIRGFNAADKQQKYQRVVYISTLVFAIATTKTISVSHSNQPEVVLMVVSCITLFVMSVTQVLVYWISRTRQINYHAVKLSQTAESHRSRLPIGEEEDNYIQLDHELAKQVQTFLSGHYLQANLKVADVARALDVSEYRIGRVLKHHYHAKNFNHYINQLRIEHAQRLLVDPINKDWPIIVIGLESGFASVGPFTRSFKQFTGMTPAQYRLEHSARVAAVNC